MKSPKASNQKIQIKAEVEIRIIKILIEYYSNKDYVVVNKILPLCVKNIRGKGSKYTVDEIDFIMSLFTLQIKVV